MAGWLREQGYEVDTASSCAQATAAVDHRLYDVVLADIRLPDGDGFEILDHCRPLIADYKIPSKIEFVDTIPKTETGKIKRKELIGSS